MTGGEKVPGLELAETMQDEGIGGAARDDFEQEHRDVQNDERDDDWSRATALSKVRHFRYWACFKKPQDTIALRGAIRDGPSILVGVLQSRHDFGSQNCVIGFPMQALQLSSSHVDVSCRQFCCGKPEGSSFRGKSTQRRFE